MRAPPQPDISDLVNGLGNLVGGGVDNEGTLTVTNCTFSNNDGLDGGAIYNDGMLTVTNSTFSNNQSTVEGGAILNNGTVNVTSGTFSGNHAPGSGGAIENTPAARRPSPTARSLATKPPASAAPSKTSKPR